MAACSTTGSDAVTDENVDAVVVATPNAQHVDVAVAAADAGKHVLVEKPMARTLAEADTMVDAAARAGVVLMTAHNLRFAAPFAALRTHVVGGGIGRLTGFRAAFGHAGPEQWVSDATWFRDPELAGGGALIDLGVHVVDLVRMVTGDEVVAVSALLDAEPGAVERAAQVVLRLRSGAAGERARELGDPTRARSPAHAVRHRRHVARRRPHASHDAAGVGRASGPAADARCRRQPGPRPRGRRRRGSDRTRHCG